MTQGWLLPGVPSPPDWRVHWDALLERYPVLTPMAYCTQDPRWHAEGDVLVHTRMVAEALARHDSWRALAPTPRSVVFAAALLHDIAKPGTTRPDEQGRLIAPGHSTRGAQRSRRVLYRAREMALPPPPLAIREQIVSLVRHHGLPLWWVDRDRPEHAAVRATMRVPGDWIALLSEADVRGRDSNDHADLYDRIEGFRDLCREGGCYDTPRSFATSITRQAYLTGRWPSPDTPAFDAGEVDVIVLSGLPGAGKDTWLQNRVSTLPVVSLDAERERLGVAPTDNQGAVIQAAREAARCHLRAREPFAWNGTNLTRSVRNSVLRLLHDYRARVRIVYLEAPYLEVLRRNQVRSDGVPVSVVERLIDRLQLPDYDEAAEVQWLESGVPAQ